jgi:hypothetical protein
MYYAAMTLPELTPILGIVAGMLAGFYAIFKYQMTQATKDREADREERKEMTKAFTRVAEATERAAREAEKRNGHLAELTIESRKATLDAIACIKVRQQVTEQHVDTQVVDHEQVISKE